MKKNKENSNLSCVQLDNKNGITLIALIVTIIVLLILAGISISMLTGNNSIIRNAQKAKVETEDATIEEKVKLAVMGAYDSNGNFDVEKLKEELNSLGVTYSETESELLIELPNGKQIMVSKTTGEIREGVHKIAYNYNGGEDIGQVPSDDTEYKEGENITIQFSPVTEREGFEFLGWSTSAGATEAEFTSTGTTTISMERKSITLYAVWKGIPHTISYDANTGTGTVPTTGTGIRGQNVAVSFTPVPTKTGYTFVGWSEDKSSDSAEYTEDGIKTLKMPAKEVTLYAIWMANSNTAYTVEHYQMDTSGNYPETATGSNTYTNGTTGASITVTDLKEDYEGFEYKYGQVDGATVETTTVSGDGSRVIKLYYERKKYTVTYNANEGDVTPTSTNGYYGATITLPTPTRAPYTFAGWYTEANGGTKVDYKTMPVNGATVYAHWKLTVGTEVAVGEENFFVIEECPHSTANVKLLAKFNLNQAATAQQNAPYSTTACKFSNSNYWNAINKDLNYDHTDAIAYTRAKSYGITKGGTGRLLTSDEVISLVTSMADKLWGKNIGATDGYLYYWLGTSHSNDNAEDYVWIMDGSREMVSTNRYNYGGEDIYESGLGITANSGVRPVLEISKSKIS